MKKLIVSALALASMIACSKNEVVEKQDFSTVITFEQVFVENATRAAVDPSTNNTTNPLTAFDVYGFMNQTDAVVFDGDDVKKNSDEKWVYTDIQYWMPGKVYYFGALAPMNSANWTLNSEGANNYGVGKVAFTNIDGTEDLLYAATAVTSGATVEECAEMEPVKLTFNHLLSKVKFSFKNTFSTNKVTVDVTDIKMTVPAKGSIDLAVENWWDGDDWTHEENTTIDLEFGNVTAMATTDSEAKEATYERLTIPTAAEHEYKVTFTITVYQSGVEAYQVAKEATIKNVALEMGKAYNFVANISQDNLGLKPIEFEVVEVKDWVTSQTPDDQVMESELRAAMIIDSAEELAAALTADVKHISVKLTSDIEVPITSLGNQTPGSGEYKLGGENTNNIYIDLNGKKLTITTTYWSGIGAKNADALITIKNGTMTSSQPTGTWNSYDLTFANCKYVFEDVVFEKAIAFDNEGKNVAIKNVTIKETHDYYAMWISAVGQNITIDGLTVESAGRGIKIDEQYVETPAKVTLNVANATFKTAKKAAIMVKSVAGAEIKVTAINIANVAADQTNAVWVDTDAAAYADKVVVTGATCITEP